MTDLSKVHLQEKMEHKHRIICALYHTSGERNWTRNELADHLKPFMSWFSFRQSLGQLLSDGVIKANKPEQRRWCAITGRYVETLTCKKPPKAMLMLLDAKGWLKPEHVPKYDFMD